MLAAVGADNIAWRGGGVGCQFIVSVVTKGKWGVAFKGATETGDTNKSSIRHNYSKKRLQQNFDVSVLSVFLSVCVSLFQSHFSQHFFWNTFQVLYLMEIKKKKN